MCQDCDKQVIEMGILESDLPNLPFKLVTCFCMVRDCKCKIKMRDYGIAPLYWWPVKVKRSKDTWRGGWCNCLHGYICTKHFPEYKQDPETFMQKYYGNDQHMFDKIIPFPKSKR